MDALKDFNFTGIALWIVPGAFIALFRSLAMRGSFPTFGKDDVAALVLGSVIYFLVILSITNFDAASEISRDHLKPWFVIVVLIVIPTAAGICLGILEASDALGRFFRRRGVDFPSPHPTAWETVFREMSPGTVLMLTLKDGTNIFGRWNGGLRGSASSTDLSIMDLYLGEIGSIDRQGRYVPHEPPRGAYIAPSEIRFFEIVNVDSK